MRPIFENDQFHLLYSLSSYLFSFTTFFFHHPCLEEGRRRLSFPNAASVFEKTSNVFFVSVLFVKQKINYFTSYASKETVRPTKVNSLVENSSVQK